MTRISGRTKYTCLLGNPVAHSLSPALHNTAFSALGLDYIYLAHAVEVAEIDHAFQGLRALGVSGFNVTMPHKQDACRLCDVVSPQAQLIGAVNTVHQVDGKLYGYNTDGRGYLRAVADAGCDLAGQKITMLGGGGTSAAILTQAAYDGIPAIDVFTTRPEQTRILTDQLHQQTGCTLRLFQQGDHDALQHSLSDSKLLINGTPVGMAPQVDACLVPDDFIFPDHLTVSDVIYHPEKTKLLQLAQAQGRPIFNGKYMLLYQADEAFYIWTGKRMPIDLLKQEYYQNA